MMIILKHCKDADKEHREYQRQYAHTFHKGDNVICVAKAFFKLPLEHIAGLLAHEVGHILAGKKEEREYKADEFANRFFKIRIKYKDSLYGEFLQYLNRKEVDKVLKWVEKNIFVFS